METEIHFLLGYFKSQQDNLWASQLNLLKNQSIISIMLPSSVLVRCHTMSQRIFIQVHLNKLECCGKVHLFQYFNSNYETCVLNKLNAHILK